MQELWTLNVYSFPPPPNQCSIECSKVGRFNLEKKAFHTTLQEQQLILIFNYKVNTGLSSELYLMTWQMNQQEYQTHPAISNTAENRKQRTVTNVHKSRTEYKYKQEEKLQFSFQNLFCSTVSLYLHAVFPAGWLGSFSWLNCPPGSWFETRPARASQDSLLVGAEAGGRARRKITIIPL